jgi:sialic acid synthase SpsE
LVYPAELIEVAGRKVGNSEPVLVVAEIGSNHNHDLTLAKRLIDMAARAGVDAVKFQLFQPEWIYPSNCGVVETPMGPVDFYQVLEQSALPREWVGELKAYAEGMRLIFLCTPFDSDAVNFLGTLGVAAFKIASPELNHLPLLRVAARHQKPLICSTGLSTLSDIDEALQTIRDEWPAAAVVLLQCVSAYPLPPEQSNLRVIQTLEEAFGIPVGLSDHTTDDQAVPAVAVAAGASLIEKHCTLSRGLPGPDHPFSLEPDELTRMVEVVREIETIEPEKRMALVSRRLGRERVATILGHGRKEIMPSERQIYPNDKRSIRAIKNIHSGEVLSPENVRVLRSERNLEPGLHPRYWNIILGTVAVREIPQGTAVRWEHLLTRSNHE